MDATTAVDADVINPMAKGAVQSSNKEERTAPLSFCYRKLSQFPITEAFDRADIIIFHRAMALR